jgi:glycosyltransferase involved in cell wall biosynthesis
VIGEAMSCGVPVVATAVGDARRIVGDTGLTVAPRDVAALTGAVRALLDETPAERAARAERARARINENYSLDRAVAAFDALHRHGAWPAGES